VVAGGALLTAGWLLDVTGVCPSVKRIWTPAWTLFSGGWCFLLLAGFFAAVDMAGLRRPVFPLVVIGTNSIAAYMIAHLFEDFLRGAFLRHLGPGFVNVFGAAYEPFVMGALILAAYWVMLWWMYRRRIFLRV
jgi:predicted acyltransferase